MAYINGHSVRLNARFDYDNPNAFCGFKVVVNTIASPRILNIIHSDGTEEEVTTAGTYERIIAFYSSNNGSISVVDGIHQKFNSFYDGSTAVSKPFYVPYADLTIKVQN